MTWNITASGTRAEVGRAVCDASHPQEDRATPDAIQFEKTKSAILDELDDYPEEASVSVHCTGHAPPDGNAGYRALSMSISSVYR
jgi:hypothetical protein